MLQADKRGDVKSTIIMWAIIILSLMLVFNFVYKFYKRSQEFQGEKECHDAIVLIDTLAKKSPVTGHEYAKPWPGTCKTQDRVYYDKNPEDAKKRLAELMYWCYWMMGEGVIKPFDKDWFASSRKCFVCYTVSFPSLDTPINSPEFGFYLQDNKARTKQTYYDYLKFSEEKLITTPLVDPVTKENIYSVIYISPTEFTAGTVGGLSPIGAYLLRTATGEQSYGAWSLEQITDLWKNDLVYVADIMRDEGGCIGMTGVLQNVAVETGVS